MSDAQSDMHAIYAQADLLWPAQPPVITDRDIHDGRIAEIIRWCRDKLGGQDQDLVGAARWAEASANGWSQRATYACLPACSPGKSWRRYVRDMSHYVYLMMPAPDGGRNYHSRSAADARLELELTEMVVGWLADGARGIRRTFAPLVLSSPPDLRGLD